MATNVTEIFDDAGEISSQSSETHHHKKFAGDEKNEKNEKNAVVEEIRDAGVLPEYSSDKEDYGAELYVPDDSEEFIDPRLRDYEVPLVAKTVDLHNDPTEPILTFRFWFLSTFWVVVGCAISTFYYFKPYASSLSSYAVQLLAWGMGDAMARYLPKRTFSTFGYKWSLNPGPWNAKEHALIVVAYWGSCYTAYGLGPLSAMELYFGQKINPGWGILYLLTSQMIGYGFAGVFRDILVSPPKMYYPGVLPNVALFNAMHRNPTVTKKSLAFFGWCALALFVWEWFPEFIFPLLSSLPLLCYFGHGNPIAYVLGSGTYGFGILNISLDWNYINNGLFQPMYTPLWSMMNQSAGIIFACWLLYPILYYTNFLNAQKFPAMNSDVWDDQGNPYNISRILNADYSLNQTALDGYSKPYWGVSYVFYFFWGFAASTGAMTYAALWYGKDAWATLKDAIRGRRTSYNDPYLKLMSIHPRVPHWWYLSLLAVCFALSLGTIYGGGFHLPAWGFIVMSLISWVFTFPNGILWAVANQQVGMSFLSEVIAGSLFKGQPIAVLTSLTYSRQILEQNLNLISDYKFGFYMKIPEKEMFIGQVWGTLLGPFINIALMKIVISDIGKAVLTGVKPSVNWRAQLTQAYYSLSVLWGVIGPENFFGHGSEYHFVYWAFIVGPACTFLVWLVHRRFPHWDLEHLCNPTLIFYGITTFPVYGMTNFFSAFLLSLTFMGWVYRYRPAWWRKYHYLFGVGCDCGTQVMQTVLIFCINLPDISFPQWWGNQPVFFDRCFPPNSKLPPAMQIFANGS